MYYHGSIPYRSLEGLSPLILLVTLPFDSEFEHPPHTVETPVPPCDPSPRSINGNENGSGSQSDGESGSKRTVHTIRGCTYKEFLNCQPLNFTGTKGAIGLARWTVRHDAAYEISWKDLMNMMPEAYFPRNEIQKQETLLCLRMVPGEEDKMERLHDNVKLANSLTDQIIYVFGARQADNKRRMEINPRDNHVQQPPYKRQNIARAYTSGPEEKKVTRIVGIKPEMVKHGERCMLCEEEKKPIKTLTTLQILLMLKERFPHLA
nr:hypothetical protein [Tanacetum cinerariifolium]